jgi:3-methyl-2-oxobutanoate hydroxymethyltransferase
VAPAASDAQRRKLTISTMRRLYETGQPITMMTAHDYPSALAVQKAGIDICLVGDSLAMVALGYDSTTKLTMDEMLHHSRAVSRAIKWPFLVGDMPFGTYESCPEDAVRSAVRMMREGGTLDAVKLEGGVEMKGQIHAITSVGIPVLGHVGLCPQRTASLGGFRVQGKTLERAQGIVRDALAVQDAGAFAVVLEAIPEVVATHITRKLSIPTIGIGAGPGTSGQVLVQLDMLGMYDRFLPKYVFNVSQ